MNPLPQASLFLGIIPALVIMFISLKGYEGYYKDKTVFLTFIAGIIMGFIAAFVQSIFINLVVISTILLAVFDQLFKTIVLNIRRFQLKKETTIYGLSLGLGFGSSFTPFMIIAVSSLISNDIYVLSLIGLGSLGIIFFHGATGAYIGFGVYSGSLVKKLIVAILLELPLSLMIGLMIFYSTLSIKLQIVFASAAIAYGIIVFWYMIKNVIPLIKKKRKTKNSS